MKDVAIPSLAQKCLDHDLSSFLLGLQVGVGSLCNDRHLRASPVFSEARVLGQRMLGAHFLSGTPQ